MRLVINPEIGQHITDIAGLLGDQWRGRVMHMQQQIRLYHLFQCAFERLDKFGRQLADEPDRVGKHHLPAGWQGNGAHGRVEGGEQHVLAEDARPGQAVEQRRFASIGIADQRHRRHLAARPVATLQMACPLNLFQFLANADNTVHQHPAVKFDLALAGAAKKAAATALPLKVGPASHQTGALKGQGGKLNLKTASMSLRAGPENLQDQCRAIDDLAFGGCFQIALLDRAEAGIDNNDRRVVLVDLRCQPVDIAAAKKGAGARLVKRHGLGKHHLQPDGGDKLHRLLQHRPGTARQRHAAHLRMNDECCRYAQFCVS